MGRSEFRIIRAALIVWFPAVMCLDAGNATVDDLPADRNGAVRLKFMAPVTETPVIPLPPLASEVERTGGEDDGWQVTGLIRGSVYVAENDLGKCLRRNGWRLKKRIVISRTENAASLLFEWRKGGSILMAGLRQTGLAESRFRMGLSPGVSETER